MDHREFLKHFLATERLLTGYLLAATGSLHDAEDLLQEVSVVLWEHFDRYDRARPFSLWALGVARKKVLKWRERAARTRGLLSMEALDRMADAAAKEADKLAARRALLQDCLQALPEEVREVTRLRYGEGLPIREVAERSGRTVRAIEMALVRVRGALRSCVDRKLAGGQEMSS